ncbi:MAG: AarF/UbiB family protein [Gemmatimonadetes bacterium]|nr:AarF/UbiB family protein [Gemmatimonadota bacterium]MDA1102872.1 AarF/UbiB family protein [Gemmatimonadota bacterium]
MRGLARTLSVALRLFPYGVAFLRDRRSWIVFGRPAVRGEGHHERRAERLTARLAHLGPTFIKLAQLLSSRADILPEPYLSEIGKLQDQVPPDPADEIRRVIEAELGAPTSDLFEDFQDVPEAAASLGQVHRARVDGRDVVVKVLRPGVEASVALDLDISFRLLFWVNILFPNHHVRALTNVVREFSVRVRDEMDFEQEAENVARFQRVFADQRKVRAPAVLPRFTRRRVLVMEHCEGTKIDKLHGHFESGRLSFRQVMESLTNVYLRMMMVDGFMHADPHPGNLLVQDDGTIVVLDWGAVLEVPKWTRESILGVALALGREDIDGVINEMYRLGMISPEVSRGEIREAATEILRIVERAKTTNRQMIVGDVIAQLLDTFYTWPLVLPQELVYFFRTSALIEGLAFHYDKRFDGLSFIRAIVLDNQMEILRTTRQLPAQMAKSFVEESQSVVRSVRDLVTRAEREELRVRIHPRDIQQQERFLHLQARRLLLSIFASATAVITSILFIALRNWWLLGLGLLAALFMFVVVLFIPTHLLENPLRHARGIRTNGRR